LISRHNQKLNWTCLMRKNKPHWFLLKLKFVLRIMRMKLIDAWAYIYHKWYASWWMFTNQ